MMDDNFLHNVTEMIEREIKKIAEHEGEDLDYYEFKLTCNILNENSEIIENLVLYEKVHDGYCTFCGKKTYYYDSKKQMHLCADCYGKILKNEGKVKG